MNRITIAKLRPWLQYTQMGSSNRPSFISAQPFRLKADRRRLEHAGEGSFGIGTIPRVYHAKESGHAYPPSPSVQSGLAVDGWTLNQS
jgi:hypothetical protein